MKNLPKNMIPDKDNMVYYDTEKGMFYMIEWEDNGNGETPIRHYIRNLEIKYKQNNISKGHKANP